MSSEININSEVTEITIENTSFDRSFNLSCEQAKGEDFVLVQIDDLKINIDLSIALELSLKLGAFFNFEMIDLESSEHGVKP
ncbi:hypothetical protein [Acinetobacter sp.]|uniref:hypothetical protein n=1 Tax=Acinetobacter sp. TaxID=472 RepID=UPI00388E4A63